MDDANAIWVYGLAVVSGVWCNGQAPQLLFSYVYFLLSSFISFSSRDNTSSFLILYALPIFAALKSPRWIISLTVRCETFKYLATSATVSNSGSFICYSLPFYAFLFPCMRILPHRQFPVKPQFSFTNPGHTL